MLKKIFIFFILLISLTSVGMLYYKNEVKEQKIDNIMDQVRQTLDFRLMMR